MDAKWWIIIDYVEKEHCGYILRDKLVCRQIHTGTATLVIPGSAVLRAELLEVFHDSPFGQPCWPSRLASYDSLIITQILLMGHVS